MGTHTLIRTIWEWVLMCHWLITLISLTVCQPRPGWTRMGFRNLGDLFSFYAHHEPGVIPPPPANRRLPTAVTKSFVLPGACQHRRRCWCRGCNIRYIFRRPSVCLLVSVSTRPATFVCLLHHKHWVHANDHLLRTTNDRAPSYSVLIAYWKNAASIDHYSINWTGN